MLRHTVARAAAAAAPRTAAATASAAARCVRPSSALPASRHSAAAVHAIAALHTSVRRCSSSPPPDLDAALRADPAMRKALADPAQRAMLSQLFSNPAQLDAMLSNSMIKGMIRMKPGGAQMIAMLEDPAQRAAMLSAIQSGAVDQLVGEMAQRAEKMESTATATTAAEVVTPPPPAAAKITPAAPASAPARPAAVASKGPVVTAPSTPVHRHRMPPPAPSSPVNRTPTVTPATPAAPAVAAPVPSPPTPAAPAAAAQDPAIAAALSDPRLAGMLSNPSMRAALNDPRIHELLSNPAAASEKMQSMLSNPLMRMAASKMIPGMDDMLKQMDAQTPEQRAAMMDRMKDGQVMSAVVSKAQETIKSQEAAAAAAAAATAAAEKQAAIAAAAAAAKAEAQAQAAAKPAMAAAASTPVSGSDSDSGANKQPPPPPPAAGPTFPAASASKPAASSKSQFSWSDLLFGLVLGVLLFQLALFLGDHPAVIDDVLSAAAEDELVQAQIGTPLSEPWAGVTWSGNVTEHQAQLVIPVQGPKGSGTLHARAMWDAHGKGWKLMLLQTTLGSQPDSAQKHSLIIPDRFVIKPRYVSPAEAERIRLKYESMQRAMAEKHGLPMPAPLPRMDQPTTAPDAAAAANTPAAAQKKSWWWPF